MKFQYLKKAIWNIYIQTNQNKEEEIATFLCCCFLLITPTLYFIIYLTLVGELNGERMATSSWPGTNTTTVE